MTTIRKFVENAWVRLFARAVLFGVAAATTFLQTADDPFSTAALYGALAAGAWAGLEYLLPLLNNTVGLTTKGGS